ncbi:hypothetical protein DPX16_12804 [Anabarilius grahami]|uniref:Uncharacterized protein n=1 Tax=Anabarilius grahami TaxID=495550 RepID=A0A3N0Z911_ANAGA|nr:hypothetical protein DPX16_12804 [Anabarilius grahami]
MERTGRYSEDGRSCCSLPPGKSALGLDSHVFLAMTKTPGKHSQSNGGESYGDHTLPEGRWHVEDTYGLTHSNAYGNL